MLSRSIEITNAGNLKEILETASRTCSIYGKKGTVIISNPRLLEIGKRENKFVSGSEKMGGQ